MKSPRRRILFVGPLPAPIGGVSSHVQRLVAFLASRGAACSVLDIYPTAAKERVPGVAHEVAPVGGLLAMAWLLFRLQLGRHDVVHLHFSQAVGRFALVAGLLIKRGRRLILTLHHGDQAAVMRRAPGPARRLACAALRRADTIVALSEQQLAFYRELGLPEERLVLWKSALPLAVEPDPELLPAELRGLRPVEAGGNDTILMTSGYPEETYGYAQCLGLLDRLSARIPCKLCVCLYGTSSDPAYEAALRAELTGRADVILVGPLPPAGFLALLARASVYLRPSRVDSYGLAITDALNVGTPCLASDVCNRDPRCEIYPTGDHEAFLALATELIERGRSGPGRRPTDLADPDAFGFIEACYQG